MYSLLSTRQKSPAQAQPALPVRSSLLPQPAQPLEEQARLRLEPRFGHDLSQVRIHAGEQAAESARAVGARAYTVGQDIVFGAGQYNPQNAQGQHLLAHELAHTIQQRTSQSPADRLAISSPGETAELEAEQAASQAMDRLSATGPMPALGAAPIGVYRTPAYLVHPTFLGRSTGAGVNPEMRDRLAAAERQMQSVFSALPASEQTNPITGAPAANVNEWAGLREALGGWRAGAGFHASGSAVDVNVTTNPYIATRSQVGGQTVLGGEAAGAGLQTERRHATQVYDRAVQFMGASTDTADVSARRGTGATRESTADVYRRFRSVSDALRDYLQFAFRDGNIRVNRPPVRNPETADLDTLLRAIPETERLPQDEAMDNLHAYMDNSEFQILHSGWPFDADRMYLRILRDYEEVRIPMVFGDPSASPASTRNPARGFVDLRQELVEALADTGRLRWGASDFGEGSSGDVQHFDLGSHFGFTPE